MSVKLRVQEADFLYRHGLYEGAWIMALIAAAATSRKRYPREVVRTDKEAFTAYIKDCGVTIMTGSGNPGLRDVEIRLGDPPDGITLHDLIYKSMRNNLIHEAVFPYEQVEMIPSKAERVGETNESKFSGEFSIPPRESNLPIRIPTHWALHLLKAVEESPENADLFGADSPE